MRAHTHTLARDTTLYPRVNEHTNAVFAKCWFPKAVEIRSLAGARLVANTYLKHHRLFFVIVVQSSTGTCFVQAL